MSNRRLEDKNKSFRCKYHIK